MNATEFFKDMPNWHPDLDYTAVINRNGRQITLANPDESNGELTDKNHTFCATDEILLFGTRGWNWKANTIARVGIDVDFDNHGHDLSERQGILDALAKVPFVQVVSSKGGTGIHAYVLLSPPVEVETRKIQKALGDAVCIAATRLASIDIKDAKCCAGGNMWQYARDAAPNGFEILKSATATLDPKDLPAGWREAADHKAAKFQFAPEHTNLEVKHLEIEKQVADTGYPIIWSDHHHGYLIHTYGLKLAAEKYGYAGLFTTDSRGSDRSKPNGYMYPLAGGGFVVYRFGDANESEWVDGTHCYLNVAAPLLQSFRHFAAGQSDKGFIFGPEQLRKCLAATGLESPTLLEDRPILAKLARNKVTLSVAKIENDTQPDGWVANGKNWQAVLDYPQESEAHRQTRLGIAAAYVRPVADGENSNLWFHRSEAGDWLKTSQSESKLIVESLGFPDTMLGNLRCNPYRLVNEPFQPEYLSERRWNINNAKYACEPANEDGETPTWDLLFDHIGKSLDDAIDHEGITNGSHYLKLWVSVMLRNPQQRLPYLYFFSRTQGTGKSTFANAMKHLINPGVGQISAETITEKFTSELEGKVLCIIEEINLNRGGAYDRIKDLITSDTVGIRKMRTDAYRVQNVSHFMQNCNSHDYIPLDSGDTRTVVGEVSPLVNPIPDGDLHELLRTEAPFMLRKLLSMELPEPHDSRLYLPVLNTVVKEQIVSGTYEADLTDSEKAVKKFNERFLKPGGFTPRILLWDQYVQFMARAENKDIPAVHRNQLMELLNKHCNLRITTRRHRVDGQRVHCYDGITFSFDA